MNTIEVWCISPDRVRPGEWAECRRWLDAREQARAARFAVDRDRRLFVLGRALLRASLSRQTGRPPDHWKFIVDPVGRPILSEPSQWVFSVAHTAGAVVCAVAWDLDLGVDVEQLDRSRCWDDILLAAFTQGELSYLAQFSQFERAERACALWTLKEAYAKARGLGLALPFDRLGFDLEKDDFGFEPAPDIEPEPSQWSFLRFETGGEHCAALGWTGEAEVEVRRISGLQTISP